MRGLIILSLLFAVLAGVAAMDGPGIVPLGLGFAAVLCAIVARFSR